jgi:hypothetical protein
MASDLRGRVAEIDSVLAAGIRERLAKHAAAEAERRIRLAERRSVYDRQAADTSKAVADHDARIDQFERELSSCAKSTSGSTS